MKMLIIIFNIFTRRETSKSFFKEEKIQFQQIIMYIISNLYKYIIFLNGKRRMEFLVFYPYLIRYYVYKLSPNLDKYISLNFSISIPNRSYHSLKINSSKCVWAYMYLYGLYNFLKQKPEILKFQKPLLHFTIYILNKCK